MKNIKKVIALVMIIVSLCNFIFLNKTYAENNFGSVGEDSQKPKGSGATYVNGDAEVGGNIVADVVDEGAVPQKKGSQTKTTTSFSNAGVSAVGFVIGILARLVNISIALQLDVLIGQLTFTEENGELEYFLTIDRLVFNKIALLNVNYFNTNDSYTVGDTTITADNSNKTVKEAIAQVYYVSRVMALIIGLLVLIYIGIRMATSTIASDEAKYKKMLTSWVESVVIIFVLPYIISAVIRLGEMFVGILYNIRNSVIASNGDIFENVVRDQALNMSLTASGLQVAMWSIIYWVLLFLEIKFLWTYIKRFFMVGFLIAIAPLITITYSVDKAGDEQAQAFSNWIREFLLNIMIQPIHAVIYLVIVVTANNIAISAPLVAIALLFSIGATEKMIKTVFHLEGSVTLRNLGDKFKEG